MLTRNQAAVFLSEFLDYFGDQTILAEFDEQGILTVYTNPYVSFDSLVVNICENIFDIFYYTEHQKIAIRPFGSNDEILISIN